MSPKKFPAREINSEFPSGKKTEVDEEIIKDISYRSPESYLLLYLVYPYGINFTPSSDANYPQQDHIFSQDELEKAGYDKNDIHRIGNIRLVTANANQRKSYTPYKEWIKTESSKELELTLIPDKPEDWDVNNYKEFVQKREQKILEKIKNLL